MLRLLIAISCLIPVITLGAAPIPKDAKKPVLYFPTKVGAKWVYEFEDGTTYTEAVTKVQKGKDGGFRVTAGKVRDEVALALDLYEVSDKGLFLLEAGKAAFDPPMSYINLSQKVGVKWENKSTLLGDIVDHGTRRIVEIEKVEVPAGKFDAIRIENQPPATVGQKAEQVTHTYWYAPDVGLVKLSSTKKDVNRVLKSFTPGKD